MVPLGDIIRKYGVSFHSNADDTQLYISSQPDNAYKCAKLMQGIVDKQMTVSLINKLQLVQNAAARFLTRTRKYEHVSPVLSQHCTGSRLTILYALKSC